MTYWNGSSWTEEEPHAAPPKPTAARWAATLVMVLGLAALLLPLQGAAASARRTSPHLTVACGSACTVGGDLTVRGTGFTPSAGGQQVILWIEYPDDYCSSSACHGFYYHPWVNVDGSFSKTFTDAILQAGSGGVEAIQYNARTDKWVSVSYVDFDVN